MEWLIPIIQFQKSLVTKQASLLYTYRNSLPFLLIEIIYKDIGWKYLFAYYSQDGLFPLITLFTRLNT